MPNSKTSDGSAVFRAANSEGVADDVTVPPAPPFRSVLLQFLKQLASATTDLHLLTAPTVILNGTSLLEYSAHWADHPELLARMTDPAQPLDRMLAVCTWFLSSLYGSYAARSSATGFERKPYNPILGERFLASWPDTGFGATRVACEQVVHHPPVTGFYLENDAAKVYVSGHSGIDTNFTGMAIKVVQRGQVFVYLGEHCEEYIITLPDIYIRGLLTGSPFLELAGITNILSTSACEAQINFLAKPWVGGQYDRISGWVASGNEISFELDGLWSGAVTLKEHGAKASDRLLFDAATANPRRPIVKPLDQQDPLESRRVWQRVTEALVAQDYDRATMEKTAIEEEQRMLRRDRAARGIKWAPKLFIFAPYCFMPIEGHPRIATPLSITTSSNSASQSSSSYSLSSLASLGESLSSASLRPRKRRSRWNLEDYPGRWIFAEFDSRMLKNIALESGGPAAAAISPKTSPSADHPATL